MGFLKGSKEKDSEVRYLRALVKELHDKLLAFSDKAFANHIAKESLRTVTPDAGYIDPYGKLGGMEANSEDEKLQKKQAEEHIRMLLG